MTTTNTTDQQTPKPDVFDVVLEVYKVLAPDIYDRKAAVSQLKQAAALIDAYAANYTPKTEHVNEPEAGDATA